MQEIEPRLTTMTVNNYATIIDDQTRAFIERTDAAFPDNAESLPITEQRRLYDAMCKLFYAGRPADVCSHDTHVMDAHGCQTPIRQYQRLDGEPTCTNTAQVQIVYLHGGGFVVGGLDSHDDVCAEICSRTGLTLTSVDYRLAPEHQHPAALDDTMRVIEQLWKIHGQAIVLCGDSAGANLAAASCHAYRNRRKRNLETNNTSKTDATTPDIAGQVLIYPGLGGSTNRGSYITHARAPMLTTAAVHFFTTIRLGSHSIIEYPSIAPLLDKDFSALPPTVAISAQCDPLCDDGREYCELINRAGGSAHWIHEDGLVHGYLRARHSVQRATDSFDRIVGAITSLAQGRWHYG